jgi:hypothetical protein
MKTHRRNYRLVHQTPWLFVNEWLLVVWLAAMSGCVAPGVRLSAMRWNARSQLHVQHQAESDALELIAKSPRELECLMERCQSPEAHELVGTWHGVNKGYGAAIAAIHQDIKVFRTCGSSVVGNNVMVTQVRIEDLQCKGWQPKKDRRTGQVKKLGNFVVVTNKSQCEKVKLRLDYTQAENPTLDPSRFLIDELVVVAPGLLLGRAYAKMNQLEIPIAYFALSKITTCDSDPR